MQAGRLLAAGYIRDRNTDSPKTSTAKDSAMTTDLYAKCPCGSGKKIKFCCKDIIADIERIERMIQGEQRTAALDKINKLLEKHPDRPALLSMKAQVFLELQQVEDAAPVVEQLLQAEPENPTALAMSAMIASVQGNTTESLRLLHKSLRCSDGVLSQMVYRTYLSICIHLIQREEFISAYAHLLTLVSITKGQDRSSVSMLMNVTSSERLPSIFQGLLIRDEAPDNVTWKREFDVAINMYRQGDWSEAASLLHGMAARILDEPVILRNEAILQAWTCQNEKAVKSFRYFAEIRDVPTADAVEAEACAQVLEPTDPADTVDMVAITKDIENADGMMEKLLSVDTIDSLPVRHNPDSDSPPPKGQFVLFDRDLSNQSDEASDDMGGELVLAELPKEVCSLTLFGKETDRSARVVAVLFKDDSFEGKLKQISDVTGEAFSADADFEIVGRLHKVERLFRPSFKVPPTTTMEQYNGLQQEWIVQQISEHWPNVPLSQFDGKTAREAAGDRKLQRRVLAAILNLEIWSDRQPFDYDFNELRAKLNLPIEAAIDPNEVNIKSLSPTQLLRLDLTKLSAPDLKFIFEVVSVRPNGSLLRSICNEILNRSDLGDEINLIEVHERMADLANTSDEQLEHLSKARDLSVKKGESPASWLVAELDLRIQRGEVDIAKRLVAEIQSRYMREPGIAQMFASVLSRYGLMPSAPGGSVPTAATAAAPAAASAEGGLWTPDSAHDPAPAAGEGGESKLWVPGMD